MENWPDMDLTIKIEILSVLTVNKNTEPTSLPDPHKISL